MNEAQVVAAAATLKTNEDDLSKLQQAFELNPKSISKTQLDDAINAVKAAKANLGTAQRQYELTKAGAWSYDIQTQEGQYNALEQTYESGKALLEKYTIRAPVDGVVIQIRAAAGTVVSTTGAYGTYTEDYGPVVVMAPSETYYQVRCYIDEILVTRLLPSRR